MRRFSYVILIVAIAGCTDDPQVTQPTRVVEKRFPTAHIRRDDALAAGPGPMLP